MGVLFKCVIFGRPRVKKNNKRIFASVGRNGKRSIRVLSSEQFKSWETAAIRLTQIARNQWESKGELFPIDTPVEAHYKFYFENRHGEADTSNLIEGPQDVLEKVGVLQNDRLIKRLTAEKFFGHEPRVEIEIRTLSQGVVE